MFKQPLDPNNKNKPSFTKYCSYCHITNQINPSQLGSKNNEMMKTKEMLMLDQNLLKNYSYITFVLPLTTEQNDMIHDFEVEVHHELITITKTTIHTTGFVPNLEIDLVMIKVLLVHNKRDHDMKTINETRDLIALIIDPLTNHLIDVTAVIDINHAHTPETTVLQDTHLHLDHLKDPEILKFIDLAHTLKTRNQFSTIQPQTQNDPINFEVNMYYPTEMANSVTPTSWFYSSYSTKLKST